MTGSHPTWAVVATVDEPPAVVQAFVAWHLMQGAAHVFIYCDRGDDPVHKVLNATAGVTSIKCDAAYWENGRPKAIEDRQVYNAGNAYALSATDWLIHLDADEFLWPRVRVAKVLAASADDSDALVVPVAERVHLAQGAGHSIYDGAFRRPFDGTNAEGRARFGRGYFLTYKGLTGHAQGKTFMRTGRAFLPSIHRAKSAIEGRGVTHHRLSPDQIELLHFDGLTPYQWGRKLDRLQGAEGSVPMPRHRQRQVAAYAKEGRGLYDRLKVLTPRIAEALHEHGLLVAHVCDPAGAVRSVFGEDVELGQEIVDTWLRSHRAQADPQGDP